MTKLLKVFDIAPGWLWAVLVAALVLFSIRLDVLRMQARVDEAGARAALLSVQLAARDAIIQESEKARGLEGALNIKTQGANDAIQNARLAAGRAAADSAERVRKLAARLLLCPSGADAGEGAGPAGGDGGGGGPVAGLRADPGGDLVVLDATAWAEATQLTAAANVAREALTECVAGWQAASVATATD